VEVEGGHQGEGRTWWASAGEGVHVASPREGRITDSFFEDNEAIGGAGTTAGFGQGGGVYASANGIACEGSSTAISGNQSSTLPNLYNDIFGVLSSCN
jgi:hypothetical protein